MARSEIPGSPTDAVRTCRHAVVLPAAGLANDAASCGARVVGINPETTPLSDNADSRLEGESGALLPRLVESPARC